MDANLAATLAASGAAIAAAIVSLVALPFTIRAANAAKAQTQLQGTIVAEARHPLLWADIRPDPDRRNVLCLMVGNSGPTSAHDVKVTIEPPVLPGSSSMACEQAQIDAASGIASVGPGRTLIWSLGVAWQLMEAPDQPERFTVTITGTASDNTRLQDQFSVRLRDIRFTSSVPSPAEGFVQEFRHFRSEESTRHRELLETLWRRPDE